MSPLGVLQFLTAVLLVHGQSPQEDTCRTTRCKPGFKCVVETIVCVTTPCPGRVEKCVPVHPGTCPKADAGLITTCDVRCQSDGDCAAKEKCCSFGCSIRCLEAVPVKPRPGSCPNDLFGQFYCFFRLSNCDGDTDCPWPLKCCGRCLRFCRMPEFPRECPQPVPGLVGTCDVRCGEGTCPPGQSCCGSCPRTCQPTVAVKPGSCPAPSIVCKKAGENTCRKDADCWGFRKCCNTGCNLECVYPDKD